MNVKRHEKWGLVTEPTEANASGASFRLRLIEHGADRGNGELHGSPEPLVWFYDVRYEESFGFPGQSVSGYYLTTATARRNGLTLQGGVPSWYITEEALAPAMEALVQAWRQGL